MYLKYVFLLLQEAVRHRAIQPEGWQNLSLMTLLVLSSAFSAYAMEPYSLRSKMYIEDEGDPFWEIRVTCSDNKTRRFIVQYEERGPWCSKQIPDECSTEPIELALVVCATGFGKALEEAQERKRREAEQAAALELAKSTLLEEKQSLQQLKTQLIEKKEELERR